MFNIEKFCNTRHAHRTIININVHAGRPVLYCIFRVLPFYTMPCILLELTLTIVLYIIKYTDLSSPRSPGSTNTAVNH